MVMCEASSDVSWSRVLSQGHKDVENDAIKMTVVGGVNRVGRRQPAKSQERKGTSSSDRTRWDAEFFALVVVCR